MRKGLSTLVVLVVLGVVTIVGIGSWTYIKNLDKSTNGAKEELDREFKSGEMSVPTPTRFIKKFSPTPTVIKDPNITSEPSPESPTPTENPCRKFNPEAGLATITVNIQPQPGETLVGDTLVKVKPQAPCPGTLPPLWGNQITDVIRQGKTSWTSPGLGPGTFRVDVKYHYTGQGFDVDAISGSNALTVTVSN
jgi:hypothetical protein